VAVLTDRPTGSAPPGWRAGLLDAGPIALAGIVANGGSVVVTLVLARLLVARDYGALNQLIGVFFVVSTPGSAVLVGVVRRVTRWPVGVGVVGRWGAEIHRRATWAVLLFALAVIAAGPAVAGLLGRHDAVGFDAVAIAGSVWVLLCVDRGLLQAKRRYRMLSANLVLEGVARTAFMIGLGVAGLGVAGVAAGVLLAEVCTAVHARVVAARAWRDAEGETTAPDDQRRPAGRAPVALRLVRSWSGSWRSTGRFARDDAVRQDLVAAVVALAAIAVLQNIDVIVMGREAPRAAGGYAAVSVSSKALVFVAIVVAGYLLPEAAISWREGRHALRQLAVSLAVLSIPAVVLVVVAGAVPRDFLSTAFSARYVSASGAFLPLALAMVCLSATVMVTMYLLAVGDRPFVVVLVAASALATLAVVLAHGAPRTTALADLGVQAVLLCVGAGELARVHRKFPSA
jgi:O-antigen/teichoic acid export membrane protein